MNKIVERMRARLASADCPITQTLSAYEATRGPVTRTTALLTQADREWSLRRSRPVTRTAAPLTRADRELINRHQDRVIRNAIATFPELAHIRRREQREAEARRKRVTDAPAKHPHARYLFPE